jgi:hypothetical protein
MASPATIAAEPSWQLHPSWPRVLAAVVRRLVPTIIEASLVPTLLFYIFSLTLDLRWAFGAALMWSFAAVAVRFAGRRRIPALLVLATTGLAVRTAVFLVSESSFIYFVQPIIRTVITAAVFAMSAVIGRPLIARFACDFCPLAGDVRARPSVDALFRRLTYLWAAVNGLTAAISLTLLLTVSVGVFYGTANAAGWILIAVGVVVTVIDAVRTARREGLATAVAPDGTLHAYAATPAEPAVRVA